MIADAAPHGHARAGSRLHLPLRWGTVAAVSLGAPALVTLLAFTSVRTVVPGLLYVVAIFLAFDLLIRPPGEEDFAAPHEQARQVRRGPSDRSA